ncbi:MAG: uracil-DNA glycosylase [Desulfuromusa sp.]|nr:uracil-DNA glycosylase [Desulfuromusa sp.]
MSDQLYHECHEVIAQGRAIFEDLQQWGFETVQPLEIDSKREAATPVIAESAAVFYVKEAVAPVVGKVSQPMSLANLQANLVNCDRCTLCQQRTNIVFGGGNPHAQVVLVGEAPGREEDIQGVPFVGEAGQLLEKILLAMNLSREVVYICNVIKCRPPGNRDPHHDEISACEPFLKQQLALIKPEIIITLGRFAAQTLLKTSIPIGKLRGQWREYEGIALMPTFHPAYLLRNQSGKRPVWEDMKQVMHRLENQAK